jgi:uncharacterized membrane protein YhaH (DUF805 family)
MNYVYTYVSLYNELFCSYVFVTKIKLTAEKAHDIKRRSFLSLLTASNISSLSPAIPIILRTELNNR